MEARFEISYWNKWSNSDWSWSWLLKSILGDTFHVWYTIVCVFTCNIVTWKLNQCKLHVIWWRWHGNKIVYCACILLLFPMYVRLLLPFHLYCPSFLQTHHCSVGPKPSPPSVPTTLAKLKALPELEVSRNSFPTCNLIEWLRNHWLIGCWLIAGCLIDHLIFQ